MYSDETIAQLGRLTKYPRGVVENVLNALETSAEQKALRADAERYRLSMVAHVQPEAQEEFHARMIAARAGK